MDVQRIRAARRVCFFAFYHQDAIVADHVVHYLRALVAAGFATIVLSASPLPPDQCARLEAAGVDVMLRDNRGMDFGGWIDACQRFFPLQAEFLLLANDSVYAPVGSLDAFIERLVSVPADFYGAVASREIAPHLQSWFVLLRPEAFQSEAFAKVMEHRPHSTKLALVTDYEVGLSQRLLAAGLRYHAAFSLEGRGAIAAAMPYNPAHLLWREMIESGVPFLKVELLRLNLMRATDTAQWRAVVRTHAAELVPMIEADLARRGADKRPGLLAMSRLPAVYWPEVRALVLADARRPAPRRLRWAQIAIALARPPRWVVARMMGIARRLRG